MTLPRLGAHLSAAGGAEAIVARARSVGAEVVQLFSSNPRQWPRGRERLEELLHLGRSLREAGLPLFAHSIYLINLASPDDELFGKSCRALAHAVLFGAAVGAAGVVTHLGSHRGGGFPSARSRVARGVAEALAHARATLETGSGASALASPRLLLEGSSGGGNSVGGSIAELAAVRSAVAELGWDVGFCLDTAHLFASGRPIQTQAGVDDLLREIEDGAGLEAVGLVHLNDSKSAAGSRSDRHENLGEGFIGRDGLALWVRDHRLRSVPFVLEVPGFDGKGPDRKNLERAQRLRSPRPAKVPIS